MAEGLARGLNQGPNYLGSFACLPGRVQKKPIKIGIIVFSQLGQIGRAASLPHPHPMHMEALQFIERVEQKPGNMHMFLARALKCCKSDFETFLASELEVEVSAVTLKKLEK